MRASQLVTYLNNEIRKHGDKDIVVTASTAYETVAGESITISSYGNCTEIRVNDCM